MAKPHRDLFDPIAPESELDPRFVAISTAVHFEPGRSVMRDVFASYHDRDGNFVEQFQTTGFDSRIWELYLWAYLEDAGFEVRDFVSPDYVVSKSGQVVCIEAVTAHGPDTEKHDVLSPWWEDFTYEVEREAHRLGDVVPIRLGSSLYSKLQKKYWELPHVAGRPLILAIESFFDGESLLDTDAGLGSYLYGYRHYAGHDFRGQLVVRAMRVGQHEHGAKEVPSGFFELPDARHISAVLFSNSGTTSKFNRLGQQGRYKSSRLVMVRRGFCYDHNPNATNPEPFAYTVGETEHVEPWGEGLSMFHNPNAEIPCDRALFPDAAHHRLENGIVLSEVPDFHPMVSMTLNVAAAPRQE